MKRLLVLALLGFLANRADAQLFKVLSGEPNKKWWAKNGYEPPPLGPWYNYWPLEAHFQVPAMPEYPYWGAPQTLPVVPPAPYGAKPIPGLAPSNQGMSALPYGGYPGYGTPQAPARNQPPAHMNPANAPNANFNNANPALSGYPRYNYPFAPQGYPQYPYRAPAIPNAGFPQR